jgi:hypothetical protein
VISEDKMDQILKDIQYVTVIILNIIMAFFFFLYIQKVTNNSLDFMISSVNLVKEFIFKARINA